MIAFIVIKADSVNGLTMDRKTRSDSISHLNTIFILVQIYENTGVPDHILWVSETHIFVITYLQQQEDTGFSLELHCCKLSAKITQEGTQDNY